MGKPLPLFRGTQIAARIKPFSKHKTEGIVWDGIPQVLAELNKQIESIDNRTVSGVKAAALVVKADAILLAPIDVGNLRNSAFVVWGGKKGTKSNTKGSGEFKNKGKGDNAARESSRFTATVAAETSTHSITPFAKIGFTASYATVVHEDLTVQRKKGQPKFLERALFDNKKEILRQITIRAKIK